MQKHDLHGTKLEMKNIEWEWSRRWTNEEKGTSYTIKDPIDWLEMKLGESLPMILRSRKQRKHE